MSPLIYRGTSDVARWCGGVTRAAVGMWMIRHPDEIPEPRVAIANEGTDQVTRGWGLDQRDEWMVFAAALLPSGPGRTSNAAARSVSRAAAEITRQAGTGEITERTAIKLLTALIGTAPLKPATKEGPS